MSTLHKEKYHGNLQIECTSSAWFTDNLGLKSAVYVYTNTRSRGYGSQGPKVPETVIKA
jgi:hypothetical protein